MNKSNRIWEFEHQIVESVVFGADEVACGDIDGDGRIDILCSQSEGKQRPIRWYRNLGGDPPQWKRSDRITSFCEDWTGEMGWMGSWLGDFDGDGHLDVVSSAKGNFSGLDSPVCWFENVNGDGTEWVKHILPVTGDLLDHCRIADFNGDGRDEIIAQKYHGDGVYYLVCTPPKDPRVTENWQCYRIGKGRAGLCLGDIDGDGYLDVLVDNQWLKNPGIPGQENWSVYRITGAPSGVKNAAGDINGNGRLDIVLSSEEGKGIWWFEAPVEPAKGEWIKHVISKDYSGAHTLWLADFKGDGHLDVLTAEMHTRGKHRVTVFENVDRTGQRWVEHIIATTGSHNAIAVDINGNGMPDIVGCNFGEHSCLEVWYNRAK